MSLAEEVEARKARLNALRARKAAALPGENGNSHAVSLLSQRNFDPDTRTLKRAAPEVEDTVEKGVDGLVETILADDQKLQQAELDLFNIAPKRPNWDLKRDLEKKLAPLERRTKEAIYTLVRRRLANDKGDSKDIAGAMDARAAAEDDGDEEDE